MVSKEFIHGLGNRPMVIWFGYDPADFVGDTSCVFRSPLVISFCRQLDVQVWRWISKLKYDTRIMARVRISKKRDIPWVLVRN